MSSPIVVVGAALTAATAVEQLRESGYEGPIVVYGDETHLPYERPPLSKAYLLGDAELDEAFVHDAGWYDEHDVDLRLGTTVTGVDRAGKVVHTSSGDQPYDQLLLATGASPRRLAMADESGAPVAYLRTIEDSDRLRAAFAAGNRIAIVGGGWIGLEVAAAARTAGCEVTVLESLDLPLLRVLGPEVAERFAALHRGHGVDLRTGVELASVEKQGEGAVVRLVDGGVVEADLLVVGVGVVPNTRLAEDAGLDVDNGVLVDEHLRSSDPAIFAAGDIANAQHPILGRRLRVEHWDNAIGQGRTAGRNLAGEDVAHDRLPYFFTDQYDLGMEYVGSTGPEGYDKVVLRGGPADDAFVAFWLRDGVVLAGMHANDWDAIDPIRQIVGSSPDLSRLEDPSVALSDIAPASG
jgi:3-phenylpropionate/trans-cinnamate dioxygenase ferredoxin reductase subunit